MSFPDQHIVQLMTSKIAYLFEIAKLSSWSYATTAYLKYCIVTFGVIAVDATRNIESSVDCH